MMKCKYCDIKPALIISKYLIVEKCYECGQAVVSKVDKDKDFNEQLVCLRREWNIAQFLPISTHTHYFK